jgi:hypothetical protein
MAKKPSKPKKKPAAKLAVRKDGEIDLRTLPADKRPEPTTGQSREEFQLPLEDLSAAEAKVIKAVNGKNKGPREVYGVAMLAKSTRLTPLQVRNAIRRLVPSTWVERVEKVPGEDGKLVAVRGHYRISERGRKRL